MTKAKASVCAALDQYGRRCHGTNTENVRYHGDGEIYSYGSVHPQWVVVPLCAFHRPAPSRKSSEKRS